MALVKVKFWKVEEEFAKRFAKVPVPDEVRFPVVKTVEKRFVELAVVEKKFVVVALVPVAVVKVRD